MKNPNVAIIIPAYFEEGAIGKVVKEVKKDFDLVICVNDGSNDGTATEAKNSGAIVLNHLTNIGQGGALETGIKYSLTLPKVEYLVTFDADGQHRIEDVKKMLRNIESGAIDIVLGSRFLGEKNDIPALKILLLKAATIFTRITTGLQLTDTHNGLRVFNRAYAEKVNLRNYGMAHASEMLEIIKKGNFRYKEVPVRINYTDYSKAKGQPMINAVNIVFDLIFRGK